MGSIIKLVLQVWAFTAVLAATGMLPRATLEMGKMALAAQTHMLSHARINKALTTPAHHHRNQHRS